MESNNKWWVASLHVSKQWKDKSDTKIRELSAVYRADSQIQEDICPDDTLYDQASALKPD